MARRTKQVAVTLTERFVCDPAAVEQAMQEWPLLLAAVVKKQLLDEAPPQ